MDYRLLVIASGMVILLTIAIAIAATGVLSNMVYATSYEKSQTITQTNDCGNYWFPINVICSNLSIQTQGDENIVTASAEDDQVKENKEESSQSFTPFP